MVVAALSIEAFYRRKLTAVGPLAPLEEGRWYIFKAREAPERPVIEIRVMLKAGLSKAVVVVANYLEGDAEGALNITLFDGGDARAASGGAQVYVKSRESVRLEVELCWREGFRPSDASWGLMEAIFYIKPRLF